MRQGRALLRCSSACVRKGSARKWQMNIHFRRCVLCPAIFTRFCVFLAGCAKASIGDRKKYVRCILKYVRPILKYVWHIFRPLQTRMDKAFPKTRSVQQKSPFFLSAFSRPVPSPTNYAAAYLFIVILSCGSAKKIIEILYLMFYALQEFFIIKWFGS